jgi:hypothetical protein
MEQFGTFWFCRFHDVFNMWPMENQNVSFYRNQFMALGMMLPGVLSGYIRIWGMEISLFGCFWQPIPGLIYLAF